ncbi:CRISPR-associated helicase Cas3' [Halomonas sp. YLGW01]|uniref:CRISPR-associated helicase Cas3' n=1 Tax=Halomonas sp. YLGW01 TaxID=2773308 RepID=UPI001F5BF333|nr:CRISPR-associated helicase Cas3' [Halomonas sp. YLGW01]
MSYYRYWGKAKPAGDGAPYHLLPYHSLDVAAVGWQLLSPERALTQRMAAQLDIAPEALRRFFVFLLGLHDLGKFSRAFQGLAQSQENEMVPALPRFAYSQRHDRLGALLWQECWMEWLKDGVLNWPGSPPGRRERDQLSRTFSTLLTPMFGHHGKPVAGNGLNMRDFFGSDASGDDVQAASAFIAEWCRLSEVPWSQVQLLSPAWHEALKPLSWQLAGWAVLCDWIGSHQGHFPYHDRPMPLAEYWALAKRRAGEALTAFGFGQPPVPVAYAGMASWFDGQPVEPTPLQHQAEQAELPSGSQLFILEDITGAGKTEAACILAQRLLADGHAEGLYFALPTMATSNAMYARLGALHRRFYTPASAPSFVLAHGARELNEDFARALGHEQPVDRNYQPDEYSASYQCNHWLADSRKKALLADVGVGTVDQVLMSVLAFRHQSLRLYGLARKVLIVDEVHAYDIYMQQLLQRLLTYHARQGGSAILLTATLPRQMRQSLADAWSAGLSVESAPMLEDDFPLLTQLFREGYQEVPVAARAEVSREVQTEWLSTEEDATAVVLDAVAKGQCVAWVRNTVDDAIRAFEAVRGCHPAPERCLLFHSRFTMADRQQREARVLERLGKDSTPEARQGQVLISTQVFQESLDCDVDLMVSDLAPIDLLIQRAGRLQRHQRGQREAPRLLVLAPEWTEAPDADWLQRFLPGTHAVYRDTSLCWLTQRVLRQLGGIRLPEQARALIEGVYGADIEQVPAELEQSRLEHSSKQRKDAGLATYHALPLDDGYLSGNQWSEEVEIGTRLMDEPNVNVVLLAPAGPGRLRLWHDGVRHAAMLSQLRLRESQAKNLAALPADYQPAWEALQEREKSLRFVQPWLVENDAACHYDTRYGICFGREDSADD